MIKIDEIIIVEGIHDISFLKTFIDAYFVKTDGTSIPEETKSLLLSLKELGKEFIILTDPDYPGSYIREKILEIIPNAKIAFINKKDVRKKGTIGVENATKEGVLSALNNLISPRKSIKKQFTNIDLYNLKLVGFTNSSFLRDKVCEALFLGKCNGKQLLYRLNLIEDSKENILQKINEALNG